MVAVWVVVVVVSRSLLLPVWSVGAVRRMSGFQLDVCGVQYPGWLRFARRAARSVLCLFRGALRLIAGARRFAISRYGAR